MKSYNKILFFVALLIVSVTIIPDVFAGCCYGYTTSETGLLGCNVNVAEVDCDTNLDGVSYDPDDTCESVTVCTDTVCCYTETNCFESQPQAHSLALCSPNHTVIVPMTDGESCSPYICDSEPEVTTQKYNLSGTITDQDGNPVQDVAISIGNARTDEQGEYIIEYDAGNYTVYATKIDGVCIEQSKPVNLDSDEVLDFELVCNVEAAYRCDSLTTCTWYPTRLAYFRTRNCCNVANDPTCTVSEYPIKYDSEPFEELACIPQTNEDYCADDSIDDDEECVVLSNGDIDYNRDLGFDENNCLACDATSCKCTVQSTCNNGVCDSGETCDTCEGYDDCKDELLCELTCEEVTISIANAESVIGKKDIEVELFFSDETCATNVELEICDTNTTYCYNTSLSTDTIQHTFENLNHDIKYDFTVYATLVSGVTVSDSKSVTTGTDYCMNTNNLGTDRTFCDVEEMTGKSTRRECEDEISEQINFDISTCEDAEVCYVNGDGAPECREQVNCDLCNGVFSSFGMFNFRLTLPMYPDQVVECFDLKVSNECFQDKTTTSVDKNYECSLVGSCYSYKSEDVCDNDPCNKEGSIGNCEWQEYSGELGLGLCAPENKESQDCELCNNHNLLFNGCTDDICPLYGDMCYNTEIKAGLTLDGCYGSGAENPAGCTFYNDQNDCEAASGGSSLLEKNVLDPSDDLLGFGTCKWDATNPKKECIKDYDDDGEDDCAALGDYKKCYHDNIPPVTTVVFGEDGRIGRNHEGISWYATDNNYGSNEITTLFAIDSYALSDFFLPELLNEKLLEEDPGVHEFYYYSKDKARNLEVIKDLQFTLMSPLTITFDSFNYSGIYDEEVGNYLNDVFIEFSTNREITNCTAILNRIGLNPDTFRTEIIRNDVYHNLSYRELLSGTYELNVYCEDKYSVGHREFTFDISNNNMIQDPTPRTGVYGEDKVVQIRLKTEDEASCRISRTTTFYDQMETPLESYPNTIVITDPAKQIISSKALDIAEDKGPITITNVATGYIHKLDFTGVNDAYVFFTACRSTEDLTVQGLEEDAIFFSIDLGHPTTEVLDATTDLPFESGEVGEMHSLVFTCSDLNRANDNDFFTNTTFGCEKIYLRIENETNPTELMYIQNDNGISTASKSFNINDWVGPKKLYYYSVDHGGNTEPLKQLVVTLGIERDVNVTIRWP